MSIAGFIKCVKRFYDKKRRRVTTGTSIFNVTRNGLVNSRLDYIYFGSSSMSVGEEIQ